MKTVNVVLSLSALATSALFLASLSGEAANPSSKCRRLGLNVAECACQTALDSGSKSALRLFIRQYPGSDTACNALNSTAARVQTGDGHANRQSGQGSGPRDGNPGGTTTTSGGGTTTTTGGGTTTTTGGGTTTTTGGGTTTTTGGGTTTSGGGCTANGAGNCGVGGGSSGGNGTGNEGGGNGPGNDPGQG